MNNSHKQAAPPKCTETVLNRPETAKSEESQSILQSKGKTLQIAPYPQITRQFDFLAESVERCKREFPDCFHHKLHTAKECESLAKSLGYGVEMMLIIQQHASLDERQTDKLKKAMRASKYLIRQCKRIVKEVQRVQGENDSEEQGGSECGTK